MNIEKQIEFDKTKEIWIQFAITGQDIAENLSTFSAHIRNVLEVLQEAGPGCLVIMDEPGSGTGPTEGMGIAILEGPIKNGALFLPTPFCTIAATWPRVPTALQKTHGLFHNALGKILPKAR